MIMESVTISTTLHINRGVTYITVPKKIAENMNLNPGDAVAVKIARAEIPKDF